MATTEYRGCKKLVYAEVIKDNNLAGTGEGYVTGTVKELAPVQEIGKSVETSSETHYYDNKAQIVIGSESGDTVTFTTSVIPDSVLAEITGRTYDATKKMFIESERKEKYFAVGYILGEIGETKDEKYVWRFKGKFGIPEETSHTEDDSTDVNNMEIEYTGIYTTHEFVNGQGTGVKGSAKAIKMNKSDNLTTEADFFSEVKTPDSTFTPPTTITPEEDDD